MCHAYRLPLTNKLCSVSSPPISLVSVDHDEQTANEMQPVLLFLKGRYNLSPCSCYHRFLLGYLSLLSCFSVNLCQYAHLSFAHLCIWHASSEQQCIHRQEQLPLFISNDLLLADDERYTAVIACENLCLVKFSCVSVTSGGTEYEHTA